MVQKECVVILHDIRSVHNAGSIFRSADGAGVSRIILSGYTAGPIDHVGKERQDFKKVSLGSEKAVIWERSEIPLQDKLALLKEEGYVLVALEKTAEAIDIFQFKTPQKFVLIVGNEVDGVSAETLAVADANIGIPMRGMKESLNVSVAAGVAFYTLLR